jgi:hypothetical protein
MRKRPKEKRKGERKKARVRERWRNIEKDGERCRNIEKDEKDR